MSDIEIEIDGKKCQTKPNAMIIEVADDEGIYIPRFCYHRQLTIAANCRMCLVEVEKAPKTLPACATPVAPGMKVFTKSPKALASQKAVMEFLLINHPLDCPICDQGGECELQDLSLGFGSAESFYNEGKRSVADKDIGPLIETEMTRCIQCTRCVRFGAEIAGMPELGGTYRGENMEIGTYVEHAMKSEVSGNVIDLCPVGALTSKPFRFTARAWELQQRPTVSPHDCVGSNLNAHTRSGTVMRMVPRENMQVNEMWISDRDRFSYEGLYHADRVTKPRVKINGVWQETDWKTALEFTINGLQETISNSSADQIGTLISPNATLEEFYLLQKIMRGLGSPNIDHRLRQSDFSDQDDFSTFPGFEITFPEIEHADTIFLIGSNIQKEAPSLFIRVRKAALKGAKIIVLNPVDYLLSCNVTDKLIVAPDEMAGSLASIAKHLDLEISGNVETNAFHLAAAEQFKSGQKICFILGNVAQNLHDAATIRNITVNIANKIGATVNILTEGSNAAGGWIAGAIPHRGLANTTLEQNGLNTREMLERELKAYVLFNIEPDLDFANPVAAYNSLGKADFVVSFSLFNNVVVHQHANVILPIAAFTESAGTYVNAVGEWQHFSGVANAFEDARPAWKIFRVLGNLLHLDGFDYHSPEELYKEIENIIPKTPVGKIKSKKIETLAEVDKNKLSRIGGIPIYSVDSLVRRAKSLQAAQPILEGEVAVVRIHPSLGLKLDLKDGKEITIQQKDNSITLPVYCDESIPPRGVYLPGASPAASGLSELFGEVGLVKG